MELRRYLGVFWRWSWLIILGTVLSAGAMYALTRGQAKMYAASATILVNQATEATGPTYNDVLANQQLTKTYTRLVTSGPVLERVGAAYGLSYDNLEKIVSAEAGRETQLIDITVKHRDPQIAAQIANDIARAFSEQVRQSQLGQLASAEADLEKQVQSTQATIDERQALVRRLSTPNQPDLSEAERTQRLADAQVQVTVLREGLNSLLRQLQDLRINLARTINSVTLADPARVPVQPVSPRPLLNTALGAFLGLLLFAGIVALIEYLDDTVKTAEDVERAAGTALLGTVARFGARWWRPGAKKDQAPLVSISDRWSPAAEAYRMLRTNIEFARAGRDQRVMLVTSARAGEGKSTTASNLAVMLAQTGRTVVLVDADLRRPTLSEVFDVPNGTGLSTLFVIDDPDPVRFLRPTAAEGLMLLPSGPIPPNPAELLASERMAHIVEDLKLHADFVIFDSAPLLEVADTSALAAQVDGVVIVVDSGRTRGSVVESAVDVLERVQANLWGIILNKLSRAHAGAYYRGYRYSGQPDGDHTSHSSRPEVA